MVRHTAGCPHVTAVSVTSLASVANSVWGATEPMTCSLLKRVCTQSSPSMQDWAMQVFPRFSPPLSFPPLTLPKPLCLSVVPGAAPRWR